jgi:hypothetical protein
MSPSRLSCMHHSDLCPDIVMTLRDPQDSTDRGSVTIRLRVIVPVLDLVRPESTQSREY